MPKAIPLKLTEDVVYSYDENKTTALGRSLKKTLSPIQGGKTVVGSPLNTFADVITDAAVTPTRNCVSKNGHELQVLASSAAGLMTAVLYDVDSQGVRTYVGKRFFQLPATTHTPNGLRLINDSGATNWRIIVSTVGTSAPLGGLFSFEMTDKADFVQGLPGTTPMATAAGQKSVVWHQETGGTNNLQVSRGIAHEVDAGLVDDGVLIVAQNVVATPSLYKFDTSIAITTVSGAGISTDWYLFKTGTISGMVGTFLLLNNYSLCIPDASSGAPGALLGQLCLFIPTSSNMGLCLVSDITNGGTTLSNYTTRDLLDVSSTSTALTPATMHFSQMLQRIVFQMNAGIWVVKKFVNAMYEIVLGDSSNSQYRTAQPVPFYEFGAISVSSTYEFGGWLYMICATAGQIGSLAFDLRSVYNFDYSAVISKVIDVPNSSFITLNVQAPVRSFGRFWYRTSGFSVATGGWVAIGTDPDMTAIPNPTGKIQLKFQPRLERDSVTTPLQIIESYLITQPLTEVSGNWAASNEHSTRDAETPSKTVFQLIHPYGTGAKKMRFLAINKVSGAIVEDANTADDFAEFSKSADYGVSFSPMASANDYADAVGTEVRFNWGTPPSADVISGFFEVD